MTFKDQFRAILTEKGLTQKKAAEIIGIPLRTVENWCSGVNQPNGFVRKTVLEILAKW